MEFNIKTLTDFIENGHKIKDRDIKQTESGSERLKFAMSQLQGLLATRSIKDYNDSGEFIGKLRGYLEKLIVGNELDPKALGQIMKAELDAQGKTLELLLGNKHNSSNKEGGENANLLQNITNIQINNNNNNNNNKNGKSDDMQEISRENAQIVQQMKLFENHLKSKIKNAEDAKVIEDKSKIVDVEVVEKEVK